MKPARSFFWYAALGNSIEWYDFTLYSYFASTMSSLFFNAHHLHGLIMVFSVFAIGYLMRPLGGVFYGRIGDKYGRKKALLATIVLMAISTTLIGCLPTESTVGHYAAVLLLVLRLLQGFSAGGETAAGFIYVIEHCEKNRRGLYGSAIYAFVVFGILVASLVATFIHFIFSTAALHAYGWRIGFLLSGLMGLLIFFLRLKMPETPVYESLARNNSVAQKPFMEVLKHHKVLVCALSLLIALPASSFYYVFIFLPTATLASTSFSGGDILLINSITLTAMIVAMPCFGYLSDKTSRYRVLLTGLLLLLLFSFPLLAALNAISLVRLAIIQCVLGLMVAMFEAPLPAFLVEITRPKVRYSVIAISYNISFSIFGGFAPLVATYLLSTFRWFAISGLYLILCALVSLVALIEMRDQSKQEVELTR